MISVLPYSASDKDIWNALNAKARNGHFLFDRGYMEYHSDRFVDASYMFFEDGIALALLPANLVGDTLYSHQGLTFGGLVLDDRANSVRVLGMFDALLTSLSERGIRRIVYKPMPFIYHQRPAQEDLYALFRFNAGLIRRDITTVIDFRKPGTCSKRRQRGIRKARRGGVAFAQSENWHDYWELLTNVLADRHRVRPTHTRDEIQHLASRFPNAIRLYVATLDESVIAGVVVYETATVAHAQYIASNDEGRQTSALDGLFDFLMLHYSKSHPFFDFGISNEDNGLVLNEGLISQKEEFGGSAVAHEVYELWLASK